MNIVNQFSYVWISVGVGAILALFLWRWRKGSQWLRVGLLALYVLAALAFGLSRQYPPPEVTSLAEAEAILTNEQPTFVMLYSNYCVACLAILPAVRDLTAELSSAGIDSLLLNVHDALGSALADRFKFVFSPTFLVFTPEGREVLRANSLPRLEDIRLALAFGHS